MNPMGGTGGFYVYTVVRRWRLKCLIVDLLAFRAAIPNHGFGLCQLRAWLSLSLPLSRWEEFVICIEITQT